MRNLLLLLLVIGLFLFIYFSSIKEKTNNEISIKKNIFTSFFTRENFFIFLKSFSYYI